MTPESEQLVRETWARLHPEHDAVVAAFYARLFAASPDAHALFASTDMVEQRKKFRAMLSEIMRVLDNPDLLVSEVAASGRRHVNYGVHDRDYDDVGAALLWALQQALGSDFTPAVRDAWREAYALLAAVMRRAAHKHGAPAPGH